MTLGRHHRNRNFSTHSILVFLAMGALLAAVAAGVVAQGNSKSAAAQGTTGAAIHARTNLVMVRVVVRDAKGNPVNGLKQSDFQVFDEKKEQRISYFAAETPAASTPALAAASNSNPGAAGAAASNSPAPTAAAPQRYTALFFDDYHMQFGNLGQIRDAAKRFLDKNLDQGARVAMYSASGKVHVDFTNDRARLEQAASQLQFDLRFEPASECPPMTDFQTQEIEDNNLMESDSLSMSPDGGHGGGGLVTSSHGAAPRPAAASGGRGGVIGPLAIAGAVAGVLGCNPEDMRARASYIAALNTQGAETTLNVLNDLVHLMAETPGGERTIAMVSEGFLNEKFQQQLNALIDRALRAKVIINAMDGVGLYSPADEIHADLYKVDPSGRLPEAYAKIRVDTVNIDADVMAQIAEGTGGMFIHDSNDFVGGLGKMSAPYTTYVLGFSPADMKFDGKFHGLKVELAHAGTFTVQARRGYFAPKQAEDLATAEDDELERAVFSQDDMNALPVRFDSKLAKVDEQTRKFSVTVYVDMDSLRFRKEEGLNRDEITFMLAVFDGDGNYVTGQKKTVNMRLSDATLKRLKSAGTTNLTTAVNVKPGSYLVRGVLLEADSQQLGSGSENVTIP